MKAKKQSEHRHIFEAARGIIFFATPHGGMQIEEIREMIKDRPGYLVSRDELVEQLGRHSEFLFDHRDELATLWENRQGLGALSFYESLPTPGLRKVILVTELFVRS